MKCFGILNLNNKFMRYMTKVILFKFGLFTIIINLIKTD